MNADIVVERFFETLLRGDRPAARDIVREQTQQGAEPDRLLTDLFWPTHTMLEKLDREDQISPMAYHLATRLLRTVVDQNAAELLGASGQLRFQERSVFAACGPDEGSELGAQMAVDLLESNDFAVRFAGGGVPIDEIRALVQEEQPGVLLLFCSSASDLPGIRALIDSLHEIGACSSTQIAVGGGVFNRAEGLAEEIGADLWATDPLELVQMLIEEPETRATHDQRTVGRRNRLPKAA